MIKKKLFKIVPLLLGICMIATIGSLHLSKRISAERMRIQEEQAREEAQIEKEQMLWYESHAFMEYSATERTYGYSYYIKIDSIILPRLQINLYAYEDSTGIALTTDDIIAFLESEMDENRHSTKTWENDPIIENYVYWVELEPEGQRKVMKYFDDFYCCLVEYKKENGLEESDLPTISTLELEELAQLREKLNNPDYELTIDLTKWKKP